MYPNVKIYSTNSCHYCQLAKEFFAKKGVQYTEYNVGTDPEKRQEMVNMTGQMGVPVIVVGDQVLVGFSEPHLDQLLESAKTAETGAAAMLAPSDASVAPGTASIESTPVAPMQHTAPAPEISAAPQMTAPAEAGVPQSAPAAPSTAAPAATPTSESGGIFSKIKSMFN